MARKLGIAVLAVAAAAPVVTAPTASAAGREGPVGETVTLISGDRVSLRGDDQAPRIERGPGREKMTFVLERSQGHTYVVPGDATALVGSGKLDRRLFDVTGLLAQGYGDTARDTLPLIVRGADGGRAAARSAGATVTTELPGLGAQALRQAKNRLTELWSRIKGGGVAAFSAGVEQVWLDGKVSASLKESVPQIGAPKAWQAGFTGKDVKVAVLDTGVDGTHPELRGRVAAERNFSDSADAVDRVGHGTHVAATIGGAGSVYKGVAPDSVLLSGKVLGDDGSGPESSIIAGMEWAAEQGARLVNMSLGHPDSPGLDPLEVAIGELSAKHGTLFVVAAGNAGPTAGTLGSPGTADAALSVGAVDKADRIADFSSRGPRADGAIKPDITAPGVGIVAARAAGTSGGTPVDGQHTALNGTSMASPHVAGAAALLAQQHPEWTGQQLKAALMASARPNPALDAYAQGAGRVDVGAAIGQTAYTVPSSVSAGKPEWPHGDDKPVVTPVTYHNPGKTSLTLDLAVDGRFQDDTPAPAGMFTVDKQRIEVPSGGTATVNVTVSTAMTSPDGMYSGRVTATGKGVSVVTPVAVTKEAESYNLTVKYLDRDGKPPAGYTGQAGQVNLPFSENGVATVRVPKGRLSLNSVIETGATATLVAQPALEVNGDTTVVVDARQAKPVRVDLDRREAVARSALVVLIQPRARVLFGTTASSLSQTFTLQMGPSVSQDEMVAQLTGAWAVPDAGGGFDGSPVIYALSWFEAGRLPDGFTRRLRDSDLAEVRPDYRSGPSGFSGTKAWSPSHRGINFGFGTDFPFTPSQATRLEYHNVESNMDWRPSVVYFSGGRETFSSQRGAVVSHKAGHRYEETWNAAVAGPALPPDAKLERTGDTVDVNLPLFSDAPDRFGTRDVTSGETTLYLDGKKVGSTDELGRGKLTLQSGKGHYQLEAKAAQPAAGLSTSVSVKWTFDSAHVPGDKPKALPLQAIRFAPQGLDRDNRAAPGRPTTVPITVQRYGGAGELAGLTVEVSYDDGVTWTAVAVDGRQRVSIAHPGKPGFVSLRAKAFDTKGNGVEQTILRAFALK
ncbi:Subtilase family protein [Amycolatopsis xylanica]|uniref:Subtilase family protein n=1 Tax=Amycolatopsis xylanica TaxID=589385 RepID=A0A1H2VFQ1_9PSEU|nr:S8 family serine peptidase [Amycolatopsis xylanica]SDW67138.1 Subtilase family protein [Amycolatopsis xylanica]